MPPKKGAEPKHEAPKTKSETPQNARTRNSAPLIQRVKIESQQEQTAPSPLSKPNQRGYRLPRVRVKKETNNDVKNPFERINGVASVPRALSHKRSEHISNNEVSSQLPGGSASAPLQDQTLNVTSSATTRIPALSEILADGSDTSATPSPTSLRLPPIGQAPSRPPGLPIDRAPSAFLHEDEDEDPPPPYEEHWVPTSNAAAWTTTNTASALQPGASRGHGIATTRQASTQSTAVASITRSAAATANPTPVMRVFADTNLVERILLHLNIPTLLTCLHLSRRIHTFIKFGSLHLRRALWLEDMSPKEFYINRFRQNPHTVDPIIARLRQTLDLFFTFVEPTNTQEILWFPTSTPKNCSELNKEKLYVQNASWRQMLVMRSADEGLNWRVGMFAQGRMWYAELGARRQSPVFNEIVNVLTGLSNRARASGAR